MGRGRGEVEEGAHKHVPVRTSNTGKENMVCLRCPLILSSRDSNKQKMRKQKKPDFLDHRTPPRPCTESFKDLPLCIVEYLPRYQS